MPSSTPSRAQVDRDELAADVDRRRQDLFAEVLLLHGDGDDLRLGQKLARQFVADAAIRRRLDCERGDLRRPGPAASSQLLRKLPASTG